MKYCTDCTYCQGLTNPEKHCGIGGPLCTHPSAAQRITGKPVACFTVRYKTGACGPSGLLFQHRVRETVGELR